MFIRNIPQNDTTRLILMYPSLILFFSGLQKTIASPLSTIIHVSFDVIPITSILVIVTI